MPLNAASLILEANTIRAVAVKMRLHSGDPGVAGTANQTTAPVQSVLWTAASGTGNWGLSASVNFTGVAPSGNCSWVSLWDTTNAVWYGNFPLTGDITANSAGEFTVTGMNFTGSAT